MDMATSFWALPCRARRNNRETDSLTTLGHRHIVCTRVYDRVHKRSAMALIVITFYLPLSGLQPSEIETAMNNPEHFTLQDNIQLLRSSLDFPIPDMAKSAASSLRIMELVAPNSVHAKAALVRVGQEACSITAQIVRRIPRILPNENLNPKGFTTLVTDAKQLRDQMEQIESILEQHNSKFLRKFTEARVAERCQNIINSAIRTFKLQSEIETQIMIADIQGQVHELHAYTSQTPHTPHASIAPPSYPPSPSLQAPSFPEPQVPQYDYSTSYSRPQSPYPPQPPSPQPSPSQFHHSQPRPERTAYHANPEIRTNNGISGAPTHGTFANVQNHITPGGNISYSYVSGNVINSNRDDSFNIGGNGNSLNISFSRR
ncbi:hypothetical protein NP233_g4335 [Leucocoprinus birnbaumii]|uniref:Uncharacterized protein n=1 Tax=Leucocoprinus birnbaumii TaxID=56174 RepID=A0AAD5VUV9_9AGAR|nr:hypothetical protein NP233_g4335 [Leucocoprinus birnbaumii]